MRVLLLGGTGEARALAAALCAVRIEVLSSLAGRVTRPVLPVGAVRVGGFGGVRGLVDHLDAERFDAVVDATHPFAQTITAHAVDACAESGIPLLILRRPGWTERPGDDWRRVPDIEAAAATVRESPPGAVFLTTGRRDLHFFAADERHPFLVRTVDPPAGAVPRTMSLILDRGPYTVERETSLMREHGVALLVTKDSGGALTEAKLDAARLLGVAVLMVNRPPAPSGTEITDTVDQAVAWLLRCPEGTPGG